MKTFLLHAGVTFAICWTATIIPASTSTQQTSVVSGSESPWPDAHVAPLHESDTWRRTAQGWERTTDWVVDKPLATPAICIPFLQIHPFLVATFQGLVSVGALIAGTPAEEIADSIASVIPRGC